MRENYIYNTGYNMPPEQYSMSYQIRDNSDYPKHLKQKKNKKHGVHSNKHISPALAAHHHLYHSDSGHYSHGYYSDISNYPMSSEHYGMIKEKQQRDKSGGRPPKESKDTSYLGKFMTLGKKKTHKNKPKDNEDIYAIPRPSLNANETIQRSGILKNMRQSTGQLSGRNGLVNSKSMGNLHARGTGARRSSSSSSEEIYESMEDIINRKSVTNAVRRVQHSRAKKTGHPLFDHLRAKSQEDLLTQERTSSPQHLKSQECIPSPVWPKAVPSSRHAYHYIDDSSEIYSSSNDELEYRPELRHPRIDLQHVPEYLKDEINDYDDVYSVPRFADSATRKLYPEMRVPEMRYH